MTPPELSSSLVSMGHRSMCRERSVCAPSRTPPVDCTNEVIRMRMFSGRMVSSISRISSASREGSDRTV